MDHSVELRKFDWADLDAVRRMFGAIGGTAGTAKEADAELTRQILAHPSAKPETNLTLALVGGRVAGFRQLFPEIPISRAVAAGGVLPEFRGRGAGRPGAGGRGRRARRHRGAGGRHGEHVL